MSYVDRSDIDPGDTDTGMARLISLVDMNKETGQGLGSRSVCQFAGIDSATTTVFHQLHDFLPGFQVVSGHQDVTIDFNVSFQQVGGHVVIRRRHPRPVPQYVASNNCRAPGFRQLDYGNLRRHERHSGIDYDLTGQARSDALQCGFMGSKGNSQNDDFRLLCRSEIVSAPVIPSPPGFRLSSAAALCAFSATREPMTTSCPALAQRQARP